MSKHGDTVRAFYDAFGKGDLPGAFGFLHPDVSFHEMSSLPWGKVYTGHAGIQEFLGALVAWCGADLRCDVKQVFDATSGDVVVEAEIHVLGRTFPYLESWSFDAASGLATRIAPYLDSAALLARLREVGKL